MTNKEDAAQNEDEVAIDPKMNVVHSVFFAEGTYPKDN